MSGVSTVADNERSICTPNPPTSVMTTTSYSDSDNRNSGLHSSLDMHNNDTTYHDRLFTSLNESGDGSLLIGSDEGSETMSFFEDDLGSICTMDIGNTDFNNEENYNCSNDDHDIYKNTFEDGTTSKDNSCSGLLPFELNRSGSNDIFQPQMKITSSATVDTLGCSYYSNNETTEINNRSTSYNHQMVYRKRVQEFHESMARSIISRESLSMYENYHYKDLHSINAQQYSQLLGILHFYT